MSAQSPKTRMQIAGEYGINPKTLTRKLRTRGVRLPPGNIMPADQEIIYTIFGSTTHDLPAAAEAKTANPPDGIYGTIVSGSAVLWSVLALAFFFEMLPSLQC